MKRIINNICGTEIIYHDGKLLGPIIVNLSRDNNISITIGEKDDIGSNWWSISLISPEYLEIHGDKMNTEENLEFINIINYKWKDIIYKLKSGCDNLCGEDKYICKFYNKITNTSLLYYPDYSLLI